MESETTGPHRYFVLHKPFNMVSQFISPDRVRLLGDIPFSFPEGTHAIGRLDNHSEGLLLLTTNKKVTRLLFQGEIPHERTYLVKVKYMVSDEKITQLQNGVSIPVNDGAEYITSPCEVARVSKPGWLQNRPGMDEMEFLPHTWLLITLTEGKFHQVRKMTHAIGHKCLRLIRVSIEEMELGTLAPGAVREHTEEDFFQKLKINNWRSM